MPVRGRDKNPVEVRPGLVRTVLSRGENLMLVEVSMRKGVALQEHSHPHEQVTYIVHGTIRVVVDDEEMVLTAGESCHVPPDVPHMAEALADVMVIDAFSPPREDYWRDSLAQDLG